MRLNPDRLKQTIFIIALFVFGGLLFWWLKTFLSAFLGAVVFYILLRQPLFYLTERAKRKWNKSLAAVALMLLSFLVLVLPVMLVSIMLSGKISFLINHYQDILTQLGQWSAKAGAMLGIDLITPDTIAQITGLAAKFLPGLLSATAGALADIFVIYFLLFFMLAGARDFEETVREYLPFKEQNNRLLLAELKSQTISNSVGIIILAILQGITAWIGYLIFGVEEAFFWAAITGIMSVLPVVGTVAVWLPLAAFAYFTGNEWQAIGVAIYGAAVITNVDNVFRFLVQKKLGDTHPIITFFGVVLGLGVFGFVGVVFGPLLVSYFLLLLKIYRNEYMEEEIS